MVSRLFWAQEIASSTLATSIITLTPTDAIWDSTSLVRSEGGSIPNGSMKMASLAQRP